MIKATYEIALQNQRRSEVQPPVTGVINTRTVDTGQFVRTGTVLATIVDVSRLRLRFKLSEAESLRARRAARSPSAWSRSAHATSARTSTTSAASPIPQTRQVEVLAWVDSPEDLKPGFFAEVTLAGEKKQDALVVPESAIQASERGFVTYVVKEKTARVRSSISACAPAPVSSRSCRA